jgi:uncharacterized protein with HEPN domain
VKSSPSSPSSTQEAYLRDMLDSAQAVQKYMKGVTYDAFWDDGEKRDAVTMRISVIGEAARHITTATAAKLREIPFTAIRGMRNRVTHDYKGIDYREVWEVTQDDIIPLIEALTKYFIQHPSPIPVKTEIELARERSRTAIHKSPR